MSQSVADRRAWRTTCPPDKAWKGRAGRSRKAARAEQDRAAGGSEGRLVDLGANRVATGSVELKLYPKTRRIRAYLRWHHDGATHASYLGEVDADTRAENLALAWKVARSKGLLHDATDSWASSPSSRAVMRGNRSRDTKPEIAVRSALYAMGLRYRVAVRPLPSLRRTADVVFFRERVAVFVDGCFWHGCPEHHRPAVGENADFWSSKVEANRSRDAETNGLLTDAGWKVIRAWEHEGPEVVAERVRIAVLGRRPK